MTVAAIIFATVAWYGIGIDMLVQLVRRRRTMPNYELIHDLEFELGFRGDARKGTPAWFAECDRGTGSRAQGLWQVYSAYSVPKMTAAQVAEMAEMKRRIAKMQI